MMNETAQRLGMTQTSYVNPNGLPADGQITSARDLAILARAIIRDLPEYEYFVHIPSIRYGRRVTQNFNKLIGRYPGADGFKTGFICASGYNLVGVGDAQRQAADRGGARRVVRHDARGAGRAMLERGFANNTLSWLRPALGTVDNLAPIDASPPNLRDEMCGGKRKRPASDEDEDTVASNRRRDRRRSRDDVLRRRPAAADAAGPSEMMAAAAGALGADRRLYRPDANRRRADRRRGRSRRRTQTLRRGKKRASRPQEARRQRRRRSRRRSKPKPMPTPNPSSRVSMPASSPMRRSQAGRQAAPPATQADAKPAQAASRPAKPAKPKTTTGDAKPSRRTASRRT